MKDCSALDGCYQIYSIGDGSFLKQILDASSSMMSSGDFTVSCGIGLMLGLLLTLIRSVYTGAVKIDLGSIFISLLLYLLLFVPRVTVLIEDTYTNADYTVDNVPVGVAAPGHFISKVGYRLSEMFDQAFGQTSREYGITKRPFLEALGVISRLQDQEFLDQIWLNLKDANGGDDVKTSVHTFWRDCVMVKYQFLPGDSVLSDRHKSLFAQLAEFPSRVYGTVYYTSTGAQEANCSEAVVRINGYLQKLTPDLINRAGHFSDAFYGAASGSSSTYLSEPTNYQLLTGALQMVGNAAVDATQMVKSAILLPLFRQSAAHYYSTQLDVASATMLGQAVMQRNVQWATQQSVFMTTVRPFVTFFEGFIYAISPLMGILACTGGFGIAVAVKYFQTLVWIQLWMPILCIINLYVYAGLRDELVAQLSQSQVWDSPAALEGMRMATQSWMATAGLLASSTPLIALFIVTASTYTFTTLASHMGGSDHIDEKIMAPDLVSQPPMISNEAQTIVQSNTGAMYKSRSPQLPSISFSDSDNLALSSTLSAVKSQTVQSSLALSQNWLEQIGSSSTHENAQSVEDVVRSSNNETISSLWSQSVESARQTGTDASMVFASAMSNLLSMGSANTSSNSASRGLTASGSVAGGLAGAAGGKIGASIGLTSSEMQAQNSSSHQSLSATVDDKNAYSSGQISSSRIGERLARSYSGSNGSDLSMALSKGIINSHRTSGSSTRSHGKSENQEQRFARSLSQLQQFQTAASHSLGSSWQTGIDLKSFAFDVRNQNPAALENLRSSLMANADSAGRLSRYAADFQQRFGIVDPVSAGDMALLKAAHEGNGEQKAQVLSLWWEVNGGQTDPNLVKASSLEGQSFDAVTFHPVRVSGKGSATDTDTQRITEQVETKIDQGSNRLATQISQTKEAHANLSSLSDGIVRQGHKTVDSTLDQTLGARVSVQEDNRGDKVIYSGDRAIDLASLAKEGGGILGEAAGRIRQLGGSSYDLLASDSQSQEIKRQLMTDLPSSLQERISSSDPINASDVGKLIQDPAMVQYAAANNIDLNSPSGQDQLKLRAQLFATMQNDFHHGNVLNFALGAGAAERIGKVDQAMADLGKMSK